MKPHCCKNFTHDLQAKSGKSYQTFSLDSGNFWWVSAVNLSSGSLPVYLDNDWLPAQRRHQQGCWALRRQLRVQVMNAISPLCVSGYECFWLYCWLKWKTGFTENHGWNSGDSRSFCNFVVLKQLYTYAQVYRANPSSTSTRQETFKLHCTRTLQTASHDMWALMQPSIPNTPKYLLCTTSFKQHFNKDNNIQLTK